MDSTKRRPKVEERFALEAIEAIEGVASYRWLPEGSRPTPDLEVTLGDGQVAAVELTLCTDGATRSLYASFDGKWWPRADLMFEWVLLLSDHGPDGRERRRNLPGLIDEVVSILSAVESQVSDLETMTQTAESELARVAFGDWDAVSILKCLGPSEATSGGVRTRVAAGYWGPAGSVDELIEAVQARIDDKAAKRQLASFCGPKWLVVSLDGGLSSRQLEDAATSGDDAASRTDIEAISLTGFDEVWVVGDCFVRNLPRVVLRLFASSTASEWHSVSGCAELAEAPC